MEVPHALASKSDPRRGLIDGLSLQWLALPQPSLHAERASRGPELSEGTETLELVSFAADDVSACKSPTRKYTRGAPPTSF